MTTSVSTTMTVLDERQYQDEGVAFLRRKKRAMLTDRPGMGKTPQAARAAEMPCLVVCPNYLVQQWGDWLETYMPGTRAVCAGDRFKKARLLKSKADWTVINVQMLRTHFQEINDAHAARPWTTIIFDEAHHLRNRNAVQSQHAAKIAAKVERVYELTATPIWREVDDLWMLLNILQPKIFGSYNFFVDTFCISDKTRFGPRVLGVKKEMIAELDQLLGIVRLGRSYAEVGRQLPEKVETVIKVEMPEKVAQLYKDAKNYWIEELEGGFTNYSQVIQALRQVAAGPHKTEAIVELLEDLDTPTVVFCWFRSTAAQLGAALNATVITGEVPVKDRATLAKQAPGHVVATISSLSEGVDLSHYRTVVFAEEHYTPGSMDQAVSRVHRERQLESNEEPTRVYYFMTKDTIDEIIHNVAHRRQGTIRDVLEGAGLLR